MPRNGESGRLGKAGRSWGMGQTQEDFCSLLTTPTGYRRSTGPAKLKKISTAKTEMQTAVTIGPSAAPSSSDYATIMPREAARRNGPRVTFAGVLLGSTFVREALLEEK